MKHIAHTSFVAIFAALLGGLALCASPVFADTSVSNSISVTSSSGGTTSGGSESGESESRVFIETNVDGETVEQIDETFSGDETPVTVESSYESTDGTTSVTSSVETSVSTTGGEQTLPSAQADDDGSVPSDAHEALSHALSHGAAASGSKTKTEAQRTSGATGSVASTGTSGSSTSTTAPPAATSSDVSFQTRSATPFTFITGLFTSFTNYVFSFFRA